MKTLIFLLMLPLTVMASGGPSIQQQLLESPETNKQCQIDIKRNEFRIAKYQLKIERAKLQGRKPAWLDRYKLRYFQQELQNVLNYCNGVDEDED